MLEVRDLSCGYGQIRAVENISFDVNAGSVLALVGPNGAGKSSTIQCLAGHVDQLSGVIRFQGEDISRLSPMKRVASGIAIVPEGRRLFSDMTVRENLIIGGYCRPRSREAQNLEKILHLFPRLSERLHSKARVLSGGEQQMASIGRALMSEPSLLMIDELSLGLMPKMVDVCYDALAELRSSGLALLIVEQNTARALDASNYVCVFQSGVIVWQGDSRSEQSNIVASYLGSD